MLYGLYRGISSRLFRSPVDPVSSLVCNSRRKLITATPSASNPSPYQAKVMAVKDTVEALKANNTVAIFSKSYCPYCRRAKALFKEKYPDVKTGIIELDEVEEGFAIQEYLSQQTGQRTVPNIFINEKHVGGCDAVTALQSSGQLAGLVKA